MGTGCSHRMGTSFDRRCQVFSQLPNLLFGLRAHASLWRL